MQRLFGLLKNNRVIVLITLPLVIAVGWFIIWFVSSERTVYVWDFANYWRPSMDLSNQIQEEPKEAVRAVINRLRTDEYNLMHAVLPAMWMIVFGASRLSYEVSLYVLYFVPATFCLALLAYQFVRKYVRGKSRHIKQLVFTGIWVSILANPMLLGPMLRGYPDIVGLGLLAIALLIYLYKRDKLLVRWLLAIAVLLVLATFMRRWYIFGSVGLIIGMGIDQLYLVWKSHEEIKTTILRLVRLACLPAAYLTLFVGIAWPYVKHLIKTDYATSYAAYKYHDSYIELFGFTVNHFSLPVMVLSAISMGWLIYKSRLKATLLVVLFAATFSFFAVGRIQSIDIHQYYLLAIPMVIGIGAFPFVARDIIKTKVKGAILSVGAAVAFAAVAINFHSAFIHFLNITPVTTRLYMHPMVREDIDELTSIYNDMRDNAAGGPIYILACTFTFNIDTVRNIPISVGGVTPVHYNDFVPTTQIDARDGFSMHFFEAEVVVDSDPVGYVVKPEGQRVVTLLHDELHEGVLRPYFTVVRTYDINDGHTVYLFKRTAEIPQDVIDDILLKVKAMYPDMV